MLKVERSCITFKIFAWLNRLPFIEPIQTFPPFSVISFNSYCLSAYHNCLNSFPSLHFSLQATRVVFLLSYPLLLQIYSIGFLFNCKALSLLILFKILQLRTTFCQCSSPVHTPKATVAPTNNVLSEFLTFRPVHSLPIR